MVVVSENAKSAGKTDGTIGTKSNGTKILRKEKQFKKNVFA